MPRSRMVKPEFFDDEKLAEMSRDARLLFVGLWVNSDDYGVVKGNHKWLKSKIFPYDEISPKQFTMWINEIESRDCIRAFKEKGENYYYIRTFSKHQTINKPSQTRNPTPPEVVMSECSSPTVVLPSETETETETETEVEVNKVQPEKAAHALLFFSSTYFSVDVDYRQKLLTEYPLLDDNLLSHELSKMEDWLSDNRGRKKFGANGQMKNPKLFIKNWLDKMVVTPNSPAKVNEPKGYAGLREFLKEGQS